MTIAMVEIHDDRYGCTRLMIENTIAIVEKKKLMIENDDPYRLSIGDRECRAID